MLWGSTVYKKPICLCPMAFTNTSRPKAGGVSEAGKYGWRNCQVRDGPRMRVVYPLVNTIYFVDLPINSMVLIFP